MVARGSFALARSEDMVRWEMLPPLFVPGFITRCETPQVFTRGGRWYAIASMWPKLMTEDFKSQHPDKRFNAAALVDAAEAYNKLLAEGKPEGQAIREASGAVRSKASKLYGKK